MITLPSRLLARIAAILFLTLSAITVGRFGGAPLAYAETPTTSGATLRFCTDLLAFDIRWPTVNLDYPRVPFFNDGNNDGIADVLQVGRASLPSIASDLEVLANEAPSNLENGVRTIAADIQALANEPAPANAAQSRQEVEPVERVASVVQPGVKAENCVEMVQGATSIQPSTPPAPQPSPVTTAQLSTGEVVGLAVAGPLFVLFVISGLIYAFRRSSSSSGDRDGPVRPYETWAPRTADRQPSPPRCNACGGTRKRACPRSDCSGGYTLVDWKRTSVCSTCGGTGNVPCTSCP